MTAPAVVRVVKDCLAGAIDLVLPRACAGCETDDASAVGLCDACNRKLLSLVALPYCPRCGATIGPNIPVRDDGCAACPDTHFRFAGVVRIGPYTDPLRRIVRDLKYHRHEAMRRTLGRWLAEGVAARTTDARPEVVVSVPMHWRRRFVRGYDHARAIARSVAKELSLPLGDELLRLRDTPPQIHLPRTRRIENMRGAFDVRKNHALDGAHVLLIDDVTTTGATANEAARAMLSAGASRVTLAVIAKSEPPTAYATHWGS